MRYTGLLALLTLLLLPLLGCGQKGALYLPQTAPNSQVEQSQPPSQNSELDDSSDNIDSGNHKPK